MSSYMDAASIQRKTVLYVGGLEENVTEKTLEAAFLPFGDITQILIPKDASTSQSPHPPLPRLLSRPPPSPLLTRPSLPCCCCAPAFVLCVEAHRGFGFVEFEDPSDAAEALDNMDDAALFGRVLKVKLAKPNAMASQSVWAQQDEQRKEGEQRQEGGNAAAPS